MITLSLLALAVTVRAQRSVESPGDIKSDSIRRDFEEWCAGEPLRPTTNSASFLKPLPPSTAIIDPRLLTPRRPPVSVVIMTPQLRTDMRLACQSHWLEEQRKAQQGGAMMIGGNLISLIPFVVSKLFPDHCNRKSKEQRRREHLQQVLDNY